MKDFLIWFIQNEWAEIFFLIMMILLITILQKYHYKMLNYLKNSYWKIIVLIFWFIQRLTVIIHEFSHVIFAFVFWAKIKNIDLYSKKWGSVEFAMKDYIGSMWNFADSNKVLFIINLIFNRIGIFLTSIWPLIVWIVINLILCISLLGINIWETINILEIIKNIDRMEWFFLLIYSLVIIPSFILSFQDVKNLFIYKWDNFFASLVWSFINILILFFFLYLVTFLFVYFKLFFFSYIFSFLLTFVFFMLTKMYKRIFLRNKQIVF